MIIREIHADQRNEKWLRVVLNERPPLNKHIQLILINIFKLELSLFSLLLTVDLLYNSLKLARGIQI